MEIFFVAKRLEQDGEHYYRKLAATATGEGLPRIFNRLADMERVHYRVLCDLELGKDTLLAPAEIIADAQKIFPGLENAEAGLRPNLRHQDAYRHALDLEKKSLEFYRHAATQTEDPKAREIFLQIAAQEQDHWTIINNILEAVNRPQTWLENAEWHHAEEY